MFLLLEARNCEIFKVPKITRAPCRRRNEAVLRAVNFGDLITVLSDNLETIRISKQSSIRSRGAGSSYSMDPGVSVQVFGKACEDLS